LVAEKLEVLPLLLLEKLDPYTWVVPQVVPPFEDELTLTFVESAFVFELAPDVCSVVTVLPLPETVTVVLPDPAGTVITVEPPELTGTSTPFTVTCAAGVTGATVASEADEPPVGSVAPALGCLTEEAVTSPIAITLTIPTTATKPTYFV
jgi:hypothetical protein